MGMRRGRFLWATPVVREYSNGLFRMYEAVGSVADRSVNTFCGRIASVQRTELLTEIIIALRGNLELVSVTTTESFDFLSVDAGDTISGIVKPAEVLLRMNETGLAVSTRNSFSGRITEIRNKGITVEVLGVLDDGTPMRVLSTETSIINIGLAVGDAVLFLFKAFSVILAKF